MAAVSQERVLRDARERGIPVELVERPAADSLQAAAALLGLEPHQVVKSLVVKRSDGSFLFALIPGDRQIAWPKLRAALGVNKLQLPSAEAALQATGYERGTITPLGSSTAWPVFADASIAGRIALGAGEQGLSALVDAESLIEGLSAVVADIAS